ncbi:Hypothetical predicted protein [Pelobates cultripes]|uniref:Uncharacterized protein n=1 Tax=Pelobates cultripes TaxID=61616 RepID=A0AAD1WQG6_PELCU|nr:Hypothetical predicted protein [Pelobates cultripes]
MTKAAAAVRPSSSGWEAHTRVRPPSHFNNRKAPRTQQSPRTLVHSDRSKTKPQPAKQSARVTWFQSDPPQTSTKKRNTRLKPKAARQVEKQRSRKETR